MSILKIKDENNQWQSIASLKGVKGDPGSLTTDLKHALLQIAEKVYYIDGRGERYYQDLWNALYGDDYQENFTRVGSPHIENGILTASADGYVTTPESFNPGSSPWELTVKIYRPRLAAKYERFFSSEGLNVTTVYNAAASRLYLYSDNGDISEGQENKSVPAGKWRWLKIVFNGSCYDYGVSSDGFTYTYIGDGHTPFTGYIPSNLKTSTPIKAGVLSFLSGTGNYASVAQIDLKETEIKVNGQVWWKPYILGEAQ